MSRRLLPLVLLVLPLTARADRPMLHEYVPDVGNGELATLMGAEGSSPMGILHQGEVVGSPDGGALRPDERMLTAAAGSSANTATPPPSFRPDRQTSLEASVSYYAVFTPSVAPFKRVTALDAVELAPDGAPVLTVADSVPVAVPILGARVEDPTRARFWGSVVLDFEAGDRVSLPSVAPEARLLSARTEPAMEIRFERDSADNFFAVAVRRPSGPVRLTFLTDAPRSYFNTAIPEVRADVLRRHVAPMPPNVRRTALAFARELGIPAGSTLPAALSALVSHFRSFEESVRPPFDSGDVFLDLARGGVGVCRHRAYAFVITAQALGIPARFVHNEAHAWVEVEMGRAGYMRIDLGGSAQGVDAHGLADRPVHRPDQPDPLPRPPAYLRALGESALPPMAGGGRSTERGSDDGADPAGGAEPGVSDPGEAAAETGRGAGGARAGGAAGVTRGRTGDVSSADATAPRVVVQLVLESRAQRAYRGRGIDLRGRVLDPEGRGVAGLRIEVVLVGPEESLLGVTVTRESGWFAGTFGMPVELPVGDYALRVRTPGDARYGPAEAR